jgi:hypothetical protein
MDMINTPNESMNPKLNVSARAEPSMTSFWKTVDPIHDSEQNIKDISNIEHLGTRTMTNIENYIESASLNKNATRTTPHVWSSTNKSTNLVRNGDIDTIGSGRIGTINHSTFEARPSLNIQIDGNPDVAIKNKNALNISVSSSSGTNRIDGGLSGYQDSKQRSGIDDHFQHKSANTNLKYFDKIGDIGYKETRERKGVMIENKETVHDKKSFGQHFYSNVQAIDASNYTNQESTLHGSFQSAGTSIARFDRTHENGGFMPINDKFMDIKKNAVNQFSDRFQSDGFQNVKKF